jgi:tyrocidine synthetase III
MQDNLDKLKAAASQNVKERDYWLGQMAGDLVKSSFSIDNKNSGKEPPDSPGKSAALRIEDPLFSDLMRVSSADDQILHIILATGLTALLYKYTGNLDIIVGTPIYKQEVKGDFINTVLPLRNRLQHSTTFKELLLQMKNTLVEAGNHQNFPITLLIDMLNINWNGDGLFDTALLLENIHDKNYLRHIPLNMVFSLRRTDTCIEGEVEYSSHLYEGDTTGRILSHYKRLLALTLADTNLPLSRIDILSGEEKKQLLVDFNSTETPFSGDKTIDLLFREQVEKIPHKVAVVYEDQQLTYEELDFRSGELALLLRSEGVIPETIVALMTGRSLTMVVGILSILKTGGAYLPISPQYPQKRKQYMLADSNARIMLTNQGWESPFHQIKTIFIDNFDPPSENHQHQGIGHPENLAYVIYTSGSTGNPKGVLVPHRAVVRLVKNSNYLHFSTKERILQTGALEFDASTFEIWGALLNGGNLFLVHPEKILEAAKLKLTIENYNISSLWLTSPLFNQLVNTDDDIFPGLKNLLVGGDVLSPSHINRVRQRYPRLNIINGYGPTENTTFSTTYLIPNSSLERIGKIPIGRPIANSCAYILDSNNHLCPIGVAGELVVGGAGIARGYLNNQQLTDARFSPNSYVEKDRLYYTGDIGCWLEDGNIEFLGRRDQQVKIRGYRIELGEIEHRLLTHDDINEALVIAGADETGNLDLCVYVVSKTDFDTSELGTYLSQVLPEYMIPHYIVRMEKMPLTPNNKIDLTALPDRRSGNDKNPYVAPRNPIEMKLVDIWSIVLGLDKAEIGVSSNLFNLGGNSLRIMRLIALIDSELGVKLDFSDTFNYPTIEKLGHLIEAQKVHKYEDINPLPEQEFYEPLYGHDRLYKLCQGNTVYDVRKAYLFQGAFEPRILKTVFDTLIQRHEVLRTVFVRVNGQLKLKILKKPDFEIEEINLEQQEGEANESLVQHLLRDTGTPFDLTNGPLFKVKLIHAKKDLFIMLFTINHLIIDGWGLEVLMKEMSRLYTAYREKKRNPLTPLNLQYKDVIAWINRQLKEEKLKKEGEYWVERLKEHTAGFRLETDFPRPPKRTVNGSMVDFTLDEQSTAAIKRVNDQFGTTRFITFIALISVLLHKISGKEEIILGTNVLQRDHKIFDTQIGWFVNLLVLINKVDDNESFREFLQKAKKNILEAFSHKDYPFPKLVEDLNITPDPRHHPLYDVAVGLEVNDVDPKNRHSESDGNDFNISPYPLVDAIYSKYELIIFINVADSISVSIIYNTDLFKAETILKIKDRFAQLVKNIDSNLDKKISEL